jgi:2-polyprenyl-6-methoxyphenol hydroxylase-like FAD-dependent oxidoreductase
MKAIIVGGGIGGLTTALMLRARGIDCELFEQSDTIRELGVGINTLPHAIRELAGLGLLDKSSMRPRSEPTSCTISIATARKSGAIRAASTPVMTCRNSRFIADGCRA